MANANFIYSDYAGLLDEFQYIFVQAWRSKWELVASFSPFVVVLGSFVAFVYWNGSVVLGNTFIFRCIFPATLSNSIFLYFFGLTTPSFHLSYQGVHRILSHLYVSGAKDAHAVSPHFAQILYVAMVSALFSAPFHFTFGHASALLRLFWKYRPLSFLLGFVAFAAGVLSVHFFRCGEKT